MAATGTVTFAPGETRKAVGVSVLGDRQREASETFAVDLVSAEHAVVARARGMATIQDDD
jgi:chitinase